MEMLAVSFVVFIIVVSLIASAVAEHRRGKLAWQEVARRFDLAYTELRVWGTNREVDIDLRTETRGSGKHQTTWTVLSATLEPGAVPSGTVITREGLFAKLGKVIGGEDIDLGMPELDKILLVKGTDPAAVRAWAGRGDVARGLQDIADIGWDFRIENSSVELEKGDVVTDLDDLVEAIGSLISAARALSGKGYGALLYSDNW